jgi:hypothetical protein
LEPTNTPRGESDAGRQGQMLQTYYDRLHDIDESIRDLTNFFFTVNTLLIGLVLQFVKDDLQRLGLVILGYFVSVAILCISYKGFLAWRLYREDMRPLEKQLGYTISEKYEKRLKGTPGEKVRVTLIRLRFNFLFMLIWLVAIGWLLYTWAAANFTAQSWQPAVISLVIFLVIFYIPWIYFNGPIRPRLIWSVLGAIWGREI